ncbi:ribonuclease E activity regulator RraA [Corynebacterium sp. p3-SID1145]|uniref:ribonuclease E activity regulator RraA n=1 Tax=unclassified Corynebacterium TaxID=2624378 RepID=UPI0021A9EA23|nr:MULTISPECIES: ribonuclease E activity regulator RraA [unclassified Corynebacterium]MCT1451833.1 ribonuclease E activity regulator RraA [Corynebacterium sp. p3-SID1145]MCT1460930.1 ribonuclease E activity regulator RraA [Corynebacterium sp. p3-SID1140]
MADIQFIATADIADIHDTEVRSCDIQFRDLGGNTEFCGEIHTISCFQDNGLVKTTLNSPGKGKVLVVDGHGSMHTALMGDMIAAAGVENGWAGVIINGPIRDSAEVATMNFGCKALGTNPRKSKKDAVGEENIVLRLGGVDFVPGQYVYADSDGVVVSESPVEPK